MARKQQQRAIRTRENILDALESLLADHEFETLSIAQLAKTGGVAVGSVYSHFKDKDALLPALLERQVQRIEARVSELREKGTIDGYDVSSDNQPDLRVTVDNVVKLAHHQITQSIGIRRALMTYRRLNPDMETPLDEKLVDEAFEALEQQLEHYREDIRHADLRAAAKMVNYFINVMFLDKIVYRKSPFHDALKPDDEKLIQTYSQMIYNYLNGE